MTVLAKRTPSGLTRSPLTWSLNSAIISIIGCNRLAVLARRMLTETCCLIQLVREDERGLRFTGKRLDQVRQASQGYSRLVKQPRAFSRAGISSFSNQYGAISIAPGVFQTAPRRVTDRSSSPGGGLTESGGRTQKADHA